MSSPSRTSRHRGRLLGATVSVAVCATLGVLPAPAAASDSCQLTAPYKHVISLVLDNVHLRRDNPNVPSDVEQIPHLYNFLKSSGTVLNKHYTVLISHTAGGVTSSLTGLYPDRMGLTVTNGYDYYDQSLQTPKYTSAFKYWNAPVAAGVDNLPNMINADSGQRRTAPAPWVTYTRAGCDVGYVAAANTVLENTKTDASGDMTTIFGQGSPEWNEALASPAQAATDFVGIAVHCGQTGNSVCANASNARIDPLPDEPGGYFGYQALFGAKYVNPAITGGAAAVNNLDGQPITDRTGQPGFPGFDAMSATNSLGYVAQMQEHGIPVTYAYISDVHDNHNGAGAYGPGEPGYVAALKSYDDAFAAFFARLQRDGIDQRNTLFVVTSDENDHYAGQQATGCDGVVTPCQYNTPGGNPQHGRYDVTNGGQDVTSWTGPAQWPPAGTNGPLVGELGYNLKWLLGSTVDGAGYDISFDSAPSFYIAGQPQAEDASGNLVVNPLLRSFERRAAGLKAFDPYIDDRQLTPVGRYFVDEPTLRAIHMINADPQRNMSFTMFSEPDYYFQTFSPCGTTGSQGCLSDSYAWIHGDYTNDIGQTWLGMVGPGVKASGIDDTTWSDHTDIVPTMNALLGLHADYVSDGRVITQALSGSDDSLTNLGNVYKQLEAPYGSFAHTLIVASTNGIKADDGTYLDIERAIQSLTGERDALGAEMRGVLAGQSFGDPADLSRRGEDLLSRAQAFATGT